LILAALLSTTAAIVARTRYQAWPGIQPAEVRQAERINAIPHGDITFNEQIAAAAS